MSSARAELDSSLRRGPIKKQKVSELAPSVLTAEGPVHNIASSAIRTRLRRRQAVSPTPAEIGAHQGQGVGAKRGVTRSRPRKAAPDPKQLSAPLTVAVDIAAAVKGPAPPCPTAITSNATASVNSSSNIISSDSSDSEVETGMEQLTPYEHKRLMNIRENIKFLADINIRQAVENLKEVNKRPHRPRVKVTQPPPPPRVPSRRLRRLDPSDVPLPEKQVSSTPAEPCMVLIPPGPLKMEATNMSVEEQDVLLEVWRRSEIAETTTRASGGTGWLRGLRQGNCRITKVTKGQIRSVAVHPSTDHLLVVAGDIWGNLGFCDLDTVPGQVADSAVTQFQPHLDHVLCLRFSPARRACLYSCSLDGSLRCTDLHRGFFDEVYTDRSGLTDFDFQSEDGTTLLVSRCDGAVELVDCRSPRKCGGSGGERRWTAHGSRVHSVHVHPVHKHYFVTASTDHTVQIHDVRAVGMGRLRRGTAVAVLQQHSRVVNSAYFSPLTGSHLLTTSMDNSIHVYDTHTMDSQISCSARVCHNNQTGRWLARMRAVWVPGGEDTWVCGSVEWPRHLDVFSAAGEKLFVLGTEEMSSICTVIGFHPTRPALAACNSSGRVHVFTP